MLDSIKSLLQEKDICVLATVFGNKPHCSLMAYVTDHKCREIYMVTHRGTKKYRNLVANPWVSLLIDNREAGIVREGPSAKALTVNGVFEEIHDPEKKEQVRAKLLEKHPHMGEFVHHPEAAVISVKIDSLQLLDGISDAYFTTLDD